MSRIRKDAGRLRPTAPPHGVEGAPPRPVDTPAAPPSIRNVSRAWVSTSFPAFGDGESLTETRCPFLAENDGVRFYNSLDDLLADAGLTRPQPWWKRLLRWLDERAD